MKNTTTLARIRFLSMKGEELHAAVQHRDAEDGTSKGI
jgi:hypothetical protein